MDVGTPCIAATISAAVPKQYVHCNCIGTLSPIGLTLVLAPTQGGLNVQSGTRIGSI